MARPRTPIDVLQLEALSERQWTTEQMAAFFRVSRDTLERRYAAKMKEAKLRGTAKLLDLAWKRAAEGSDKMIMYLIERFCGPASAHLHLGDVNNVQINQYAKLSPDKLTEAIDLLSAEQKQLEDGS